MNTKRPRSVQEEDHNDEIGLRSQIDAIALQITTHEKVLEDARDTSAETQLTLLRQIYHLRKQSNDLYEQLNDALEKKRLGKIINGLIYDVGYLWSYIADDCDR